MTSEATKAEQQILNNKSKLFEQLSPKDDSHPCRDSCRHARISGTTDDLCQGRCQYDLFLRQRASAAQNSAPTNRKYDWRQYDFSYQAEPLDMNIVRSMLTDLQRLMIAIEGLGK